jgi:hypothetical protein
MDPRSVDFGKIKIGNVVHEFGGGWGPMLRAVAQIATGQAKSKQTGLIGKVARKDVAINFLLSKAAPGVGEVISLLDRGQTPEGAPVKKGPAGVAQLVYDTFEPMSVNDMRTVMGQEPTASWLILLMLMGTGVQEDVRAKPWQKGEAAKQELAVREELRLRHLPEVKLPTEVTLPGKDVLGRRKTYKLDPQEMEDFENQYMPVATKMLYDFINSPAYQSLPEEKRSPVLRRRVHMLNTRYSPNVRAKGEYLKKFKAGQIKPTNVEPEE